MISAWQILERYLYLWTEFMTDLNTNDGPENETEAFPIEPRYHPIHRIPRKIFDRLASTKLAMLLLVTILACCLVGVTVFRGERATELIFGTLWFNGLLVLLVTNTACCFFGRMWHRKLTVVSFGMILFHLSFVAMFLAIVFNSLFYFEGLLRLTEGETVANSDLNSYDTSRHGLLFSFSRLTGDTTLLQVRRGFKVDGEEKNIAYDIKMGNKGNAKRGTVYTNNKFIFDGVEYIRDREGYSLLLVMNNRQGKELYGAHFPLQSFKQKDGSFIYATGTAAGPGMISYPAEKNQALFGLQVDYLSDSKVDRTGTVRFQVWPAMNVDGKEHKMGQGTANGAAEMHSMGGMSGTMGSGGGQPMNPAAMGSVGTSGEKHEMKPLAEGTVKLNEKFAVGEHELYAKEVRYWVGMNVLYNPGKPFVLASLCAGLAGIVITTIGRMMRGR